MKYLPAGITAFALSMLATVSVAPAASADTTTVTLTVTTGSLQLDTSSGEPIVTNQRGDDLRWSLADNTDDDGTRTISVL